MAALRCCTKSKITNPSRSVLFFMIYSEKGATIILGSAAYSSDLKQSSSPHAAANTHGSYNILNTTAFTFDQSVGNHA